MTMNSELLLPGGFLGVFLQYLEQPVAGKIIFYFLAEVSMHLYSVMAKKNMFSERESKINFKSHT